MDALRTKMDNLQWEINRLDAENRRLRSENPDASDRVDRETELEQARTDVAASNERARMYEEQVRKLREEIDGRNDDTEAHERTARELEQTREELRTANDAVVNEREMAAGLKEEVDSLQTQLMELRDELENGESSVRKLRQERLRERDVAAKTAELDHYRALETERVKWEAREQRVVERMEIMRREFDKVGVHVGTDVLNDKLVAAESQLGAMSGEIESCKVVISQLEEDKLAQVQETEELQAEVALLRIKVRRGGRSRGYGEGGSVTLTSGDTVKLPGKGVATVGGDVVAHPPLRVDAPTFEPTHPPVSVPLPAPSSVSTSTAMTSSLPAVTGPSSASTSTAPAATASTMVATDPTSLPAMTTSSGVVPRPGATSATVCVMPPPGIFPASTNSLPQIQPYHGEEQKDGETFQDWLEHFEAVSQLARWDGHFKLVYLTISLRGTAKSFFRSCSTTQRSSYTLLVGELKKRFTPVQLMAIQTQMFHDRRQSPQETVDDFAQELRKLYGKSYALVARGTPEAEKVGQTVLANQFVAGLRPELQAKVVGLDGGMDELVLKARFEEAKGKELTAAKVTTPTQSKKATFTGTTDRVGSSAMSGSSSGATTKQVPRTNSTGKAMEGRKCYNCGLEGHMARACPYTKPTAREATGRRVSQLTSSKSTTNKKRKERIAELREELREAELTDSIESATGVMQTLSLGNPKSELGPTVVAPVKVNGVSTTALVDTGSPATIISLAFVMQVLVDGRSDETPEQWKKETYAKFASPDVTLKSYGGKPVDIIAQIEVTLALGKQEVRSPVLVQKDAPNDLLLGTDLLPQLGVSLVVGKGDGGLVDLLSGCEPHFVVQRNDRPMEMTSTHTTHANGQEGAAADQVGVHRGSCGIENTLPTSEREPRRRTPTSTTTLCDPPSGVIRLLTAVRIPAGHKKMVHGRVSHRQDEVLLFTPQLDEEFLRMEESVVEVGGGHCVTLVMENRSHSPIRLKKGTKLGETFAVDILNWNDMVGEGNGEQPASQEEGSVCKLVAGGNPEPARVEKLFSQLGLQIEHLESDQQERLATLLTSFQDVFALGPEELGTTDLVTHTIDTADHSPIRQPVRRTPFALRAQVDQMVMEMLEQKVIEPSTSPWASPIVLVRKKDGGVRFCVDYRKLNQITKLDEFPLPRIDDTLDLLSGARYFTALDLASGYWQVRMDPTSREKTAFTTYSGLYEFNKMPFGLVNAPATFQRLMESVLSGLARDKCLVYLDDILVIGKTIEEHNENLSRVLERIRSAGLRLKPKKCSFAQQSVEYLGHIISADGVRTDPKKLAAVRDFPQPSDVKTLRSFLGLASYYRRFVPNFASVAQPLHSLTKKDCPFVWTPDCQSAFEELKRLLTLAPVLSYPDFQKPFVLETDASGYGLGAVLAQRQEDGVIRPIAYASRSLQAHERNYGITELEGLGVVWAVKHFRPYLYGHSCDVFTDHQALKSLLNTPQPSGKLARWGMAIQELNLNILHRSGRTNANADALSRCPLPLQNSDTMSSPNEGVLAVVTTGETTEEENEGQCLASLQRQDDGLSKLISYLEMGELPEDDNLAKTFALTQSQYHIQDGVLYHIQPDCTLRIIPPEVSREELFQKVHNGVFGGHLGEVKVHGELQRHYWWKGMRTDIARWTRGCLVCATHSTGRAPRPPLTPLPVAGPFDRVGVDVVQLPRSHDGNQYAVVYMDYLTKWPEVFPVPDQSAATVARLLVEEIVSRHGVPAEILSDRGRSFLSGLMKEVETLLGFHKVNTTAYHPQTDGLVERFNRTLISMLAKTAERGGRDWDRHLPYVLFAYRASPQSSTEESPFFLLYGRDPRLPVEAMLSPSTARTPINLKEYGSELVNRMSGAWELARKSVEKAQKRQKVNYDKKSHSSDFVVGERVFLFKPAEKTGESRKLARPFHGPYRVIELGTNTARIRRVDKPWEEPMLVALQRLRHCVEEIAEEFWPPDKSRKSQRGAARPAMSGAQSDSSGGAGERPSVDTGDVEKPDPPTSDAAPMQAAEGPNKTVSGESCRLGRDGGGVRGGKWSGRLRGRKPAEDV